MKLTKKLVFSLSFCLLSRVKDRFTGGPGTTRSEWKDRPQDALVLLHFSTPLHLQIDCHFSRFLLSCAERSCGHPTEVQSCTTFQLGAANHPSSLRRDIGREECSVHGRSVCCRCFSLSRIKDIGREEGSVSKKCSKRYYSSNTPFL